MPLRETLAFVLRSLGDGSCRVLEIGAGGGELAMELMWRGHRVVAIDSAPDEVAAARERGVDARVAAWPDFVDGTFDAILFTRSLHHMDDPDAAVARAAAILEPAGRLLVEDFAFPELGPETIRWFAARASELDAAGRLSEDPSSFVATVLDAADPLEAWRRAADHVHGAAKIRAAVGSHFTIREDRGAPYLYRYLDGRIGRDELQAFLEAERTAIGTGAIESLGLRLVATTRDRGSRP